MNKFETFQTYYNSPLGALEIKGDADAIHSVLFEKGEVASAAKDLPSVLENCISQLDEFFAGRRKIFDLPLQPQGSEFQKSVWDELLKIPFGKTISYSEIALKMGDIKSVRAVGTANGKNPIAIIIPCHRVIGMNHQLVGYAGGLWRKQWLLEHEEKYARGVLRLFDN